MPIPVSRTAITMADRRRCALIWTPSGHSCAGRGGFRSGRAGVVLVGAARVAAHVVPGQELSPAARTGLPGGVQFVAFEFDVGIQRVLFGFLDVVRRLDARVWHVDPLCWVVRAWFLVILHRRPAPCRRNHRGGCASLGAGVTGATPRPGCLPDGPCPSPGMGGAQAQQPTSGPGRSRCLNPRRPYLYCFYSLSRSRIDRVRNVPADPADLLHQRGYRVTGQRLAVLRAVSREPHVTADAVAETVRAEL